MWVGMCSLSLVDAEKVVKKLDSEAIIDMLIDRLAVKETAPALTSALLAFFATASKSGALLSLIDIYI